MKRLQQSGEHVKALESQVTVYPDLLLDYQAFFTLNASRSSGFTSGPIPLSEISTYMQMFNITGFKQRRLFLERIQILDMAYLENQNHKKRGKN